MKTKMNLKEHKETADDFLMAEHYLERISLRCQKHFSKSNKVMANLDRVSSSNGLLGKVKIELDREFHELITDEEFEKMGHIYYFKSEKEKVSRFEEVRKNSEFEAMKSRRSRKQFLENDRASKKHKKDKAEQEAEFAEKHCEKHLDCCIYSGEVPQWCKDGVHPTEKK